MDRFVETIRQYPAKQQAELRVRIDIPGSWKGFHNLTPTERREKYEGEAFAYEINHKFPRKGTVAAFTSDAIKFLCKSDVLEDPQHEGFIMPVAEWNRYRHETYKDGAKDETPYIPAPATGTALTTAAAAAPSRPPIYEEFTLEGTGTHRVKPKNGSAAYDVECEWWKCKNTSGRCKVRTPFKVVKKATGKLFGHLKKCNPEAYLCICDLCRHMEVYL